MSSNFAELSVLKRVEFFRLFKKGSMGPGKYFQRLGFFENFIRYVLKKKLLELKITSRGSQLRGSARC